MIKNHTIALFILCSCLAGCRSFGELGKSARDPLVYSEPTQSDENISRIRFVSNVTGTCIVQKSHTDRKERCLVPHTMLGFYNETRDIGIPKITYRPQDYKGYYFEIKIKSEPTFVFIKTDNGPRGRCMTNFLIKPEPGKDYDFNYDQYENKKICVLHFNEITRDPTTGVTLLKPASYEIKKLFEFKFDD